MITPPPGPSRPCQCPQCPAKFDTESQVNVHLVTCQGHIACNMSDTSDSSSQVTSIVSSFTAPVPTADRSIKTDNVTHIKSNIPNVYVRFVQTYYASYKRKFSDLTAPDLIQKLKEGYKLLRSHNHQSIQKLQEEYDKDIKDNYNSKIKTIVKSLEEDGCANFSINY